MSLGQNSTNTRKKPYLVWKQREVFTIVFEQERDSSVSLLGLFSGDDEQMTEEGERFAGIPPRKQRNRTLSSPRNLSSPAIFF
ncbi:hypothetical protein NL676_012818 [Syzygium grande]|nr:hypothetical protein NL676_012818 [Syzygium grande]